MRALKNQLEILEALELLEFLEHLEKNDYAIINITFPISVLQRHLGRLQTVALQSEFHLLGLYCSDGLQ